MKKRPRGHGGSRSPHATVGGAEEAGRPAGRRPPEETKAQRPPRAPSSGRAAVGVPESHVPARRPSEPLAPRPGGGSRRPGPARRAGQRGCAAAAPARPKWATSGAAPRAGSPARAGGERERERAASARETPNRHQPPGRAPSRATRTPLGPSPGTTAAGAHAIFRADRPAPASSSPWRSRPSAVPTGRQAGGASPTPRSVRSWLWRRWHGGARGRGARVHARGGGAEPPGRPRACSRRTCLAPGSAPEWTRGPPDSGSHVGGG